MMILVMMMTILKVIMKDNGTLPLPSKPTRAQTGSQARPSCTCDDDDGDDDGDDDDDCDDNGSGGDDHDLEPRLAV